MMRQTVSKLKFDTWKSRHGRLETKYIKLKKRIIQVLLDRQKRNVFICPFHKGPDAPAARSFKEFTRIVFCRRVLDLLKVTGAE